MRIRNELKKNILLEFEYNILNNELLNNLVLPTPNVKLSVKTI